MAEVDWGAIKQEYMTTATSYRKLAHKYKVSVGAVSRRGKREEWGNDRRQVAHKVRANLIEAAADDETKRLQKLRQSADELEEQILKCMSTPDLPPGDIARMATALHRAVVIKRDLYGLLTNQEAWRRELERTKLELLKQQAQKDEQADRQIEVVFGAEASDGGWAQ